jgi:hypothetical protein
MRKIAKCNPGIHLIFSYLVKSNAQDLLLNPVPDRQLKIIGIFGFGLRANFDVIIKNSTIISLRKRSDNNY